MQLRRGPGSEMKGKKITFFYCLAMKSQNTWESNERVRIDCNPMLKNAMVQLHTHDTLAYNGRRIKRIWSVIGTKWHSISYFSMPHNANKYILPQSKSSIDVRFAYLQNETFYLDIQNKIKQNWQFGKLTNWSSLHGI